MASSELDNLVRVGQLKSEPPAAAELQGLLRSGGRRLNDAMRTELSLESRFDLAYNAAHALALAALRARGYRSESRYLVFQCLRHTVDLPNEQWRVLDQAHRKRNLAEYEGETDLDEALLARGNAPRGARGGAARCRAGAGRTRLAATASSAIRRSSSQSDPVWWLSEIDTRVGCQSRPLVSTCASTLPSKVTPPRARETADNVAPSGLDRAAVRRDCKEISVKCSVMQLAQCQSVRSNWLALVARVGDDVRSIQQFQVLEPTQRTLMPIRAQDSFAKCVLVKTPSGERRL